MVNVEYITGQRGSRGHGFGRGNGLAVYVDATATVGLTAGGGVVVFVRAEPVNLREEVPPRKVGRGFQEVRVKMNRIARFSLGELN